MHIPRHLWHVSSLQAINELQQKLLDYREVFRQTLDNPTLDYVTVSGVQVQLINFVESLGSLNFVFISG